MNNRAQWLCDYLAMKKTDTDTYMEMMGCVREIESLESKLGEALGRIDALQLDVFSAGVAEDKEHNLRIAAESRLHSARELLRKCVTTGYSRHEINCFLADSAPDESAVERQCTCHPDDNPPRPCPKKYALSECRKAAQSE